MRSHDGNQKRATNEFQSRRLRAFCCVCLALGPCWSIPTRTAAADDQRLTVVFARWAPSSAPLTVNDLRANPMLSQEDIKLLREAGAQGQVSVTGWGIFGVGVPAKAIVLLSSLPGQPIILKQPRGATLVYLQQRDGFMSYPKDGLFVERKIELRPDQARGPIVYYAVEVANGARQGGTAVFWR